MPRPVEVSLTDLLAALRPQPRQPAELASALNCSRATAHRKLAQLLQQGLVVKVGAGPNTAYRLPTPQDALSTPAQPSERVLLSMPAALAQLFAQALEFSSRVGIAQLEEVVNLLRWQSVSTDGSEPLSQQALDEIESALVYAKLLATGFARSASHGIHSPYVLPTTLDAWKLYKALTHRLAWDRCPQGSMGVSHDEPLRGDALTDFSVFSDGDSESDRVYYIETSWSRLQLMADALTLYVDCLSGRFEVLASRVEQGAVPARDGHSVNPDILKEAAQALRSVARPADRLLKHASLSACEEASAALLRCLADRSSGVFTVMGGELRATTGQSARVAVQLASLPQDMLLVRHAQGFRVLQACADRTYRVVGESHSLQTAIQQARNQGRGLPARSWSLS